MPDALEKLLEKHGDVALTSEERDKAIVIATAIQREENSSETVRDVAAIAQEAHIHPSYIAAGIQSVLLEQNANMHQRQLFVRDAIAHARQLEERIGLYVEKVDHIGEEFGNMHQAQDKLLGIEYTIDMRSSKYFAAGEPTIAVDVRKLSCSHGYAQPVVKLKAHRLNGEKRIALRSEMQFASFGQGWRPWDPLLAIPSTIKYVVLQNNTRRERTKREAQGIPVHDVTVDLWDNRSEHESFVNMYLSALAESDTRPLRQLQLEILETIPRKLEAFFEQRNDRYARLRQKIGKSSL